MIIAMISLYFIYLHLIDNAIQKHFTALIISRDKSFSSEQRASMTFSLLSLLLIDTFDDVISSTLRDAIHTAILMTWA